MLFSVLPILSLLVHGFDIDEDESTMLQVMGQVKLGSDGQDDGGNVATRSPGDPLRLYSGSQIKVEGPRKRFPTEESKPLGVPLEMAFRFKDLEKQGFVVNDTHAVFPMPRMIQAQFVRKNPVLGSLEFGVANMKWAQFRTEVSPVGSAEKLHILYSKGSWREDSYKYALEDQENQTARADEMPKPSDVRMEKSMSATFLGLITDLSQQIVRAGTDPLDVASLATLSGKPAPERFSKMSKKLQKELSLNDAKITKKMKRVKRNKDAPKGAANNCFHLLDSSGDSSVLPPMTLTSDGSGFAVRLGTLVQNFRGQTTYAPSETFSFTRGGVVFSHDTVANEIWAYHQSSSMFQVVDTDGTHVNPDAAFYLGSLAPRRGALEPDRRTNVPAPWDYNHALWKSFLATPMDYKHLFDATCIEGGSDGKYAKAREAFSSFNVMEMLKARGGDPSVTLAERTRIFWGISEMLAVHSDCLSGWLRSSIDNSHGYGINTGLVMVHMLNEIPPSSLADIIMDPNWNSMELSM